MDLQNILSELTSKFGNKFDVTAVTEKLKGIDTNNLSITEIIAKLKDSNLVGDLDGDGVQESVVEEIKGKIGNMFS